MNQGMTSKRGTNFNINRVNRFNSNETAKSLNQELLMMITHTRSLEDQLLAQQYRQQILCQQNQTYKSALQTLNSNREIQEQRIKKLQEDLRIQKMRNSELQTCENNLKDIYQEIHELTTVVQNKGQQCEMMHSQAQQIRSENQMIREHNDRINAKHAELQNKIIYFLESMTDISQNDCTRPVLSLKTYWLVLKNKMEQINEEENKSKREIDSNLSVQKQLIVKLQFEEQLLSERGQDGNKIQQLTKICKTQQSLESVVEEMLAKEDQLIQQQGKLREECRLTKVECQNQYQEHCSKWDEQCQSYDQKKRQIIFLRQNRMREIRQIEVKIEEKTERYNSFVQQQELTLKTDLNLAEMKRSRQAYYKNKYLKMKIYELIQTKNLLLQQKQLLFPDI